jgi:membrane fusion protein, multidrug efflux system
MPKLSSNPTATTGGQRRTPLLILATIVLVGVIGALAWWELYGRFEASTDDAYVNGNIVTVVPQTSGTVVEIDADNTQRVERGEPLVELDPTDARDSLQRDEANLAQAVRQVREMFATVSQLSAAVQQHQLQLAQTQIDYVRAQNLQKIRGISTENYQHAELAHSTEQAALIQAQQQLAAAEAAVANTTIATHPAVLQAEAQLRDAYLALQRTKVLSPVSGYVANRTVQVGQQVTTGTALLAVVPLNELWVDANFKETELASVRIGQSVRMESDLYGRHTIYHGHVIGLAPGTGSAFDLLPPQNATGNWIKVVQRLPVRIALDPASIAEHPLRIGLSMNVVVDTHDRSGLSLQPTATHHVDYITPVYGDQSAGVEALIDEIIRSNAGGKVLARARP